MYYTFDIIHYTVYAYYDVNYFISISRLRDCEDIELVRLRADIKDLSLAGLSPYLTVQRESVVGISKHLCGAATDLTLRYLRPNLAPPNSGPASVRNQNN